MALHIVSLTDKDKEHAIPQMAVQAQTLVLDNPKKVV